MTIDDARRNVELQAQRASAQLAQLEREYAAVLAEAGALQEDRDNVRSLLEAARRTFDDAQAALERIDDPTYGRCERCGGDIGAERLEALPGVTTCVTCQAAS